MTITSYIILFGCAFIFGTVMGLILFDVLITRPMVMQVMKEHKQQLDKERQVADSFRREAERLARLAKK